MINRLAHHTAALDALQAAAEQRRNQSAGPAETRVNFSQIFGGTAWNQSLETVNSASAAAASTRGFSDAIATATTPVLDNDTDSRLPVVAPATAAPTTTTATTSSATTTATTSTASEAGTATAATGTAATASTGATPAAGTVAAPGVEALVTAILNGSFQATYVTSPSQLQETTPVGTDTMPNFYYASNQTATQLANLLGGKVVQMPPFGQDQGWTEPDANFIQLPNGQTFNAADVAYYANTGSEGAAQLTADITSTINQGSAWTNYYQHGGAMPTFAMGYVGPPISGMTYPSGMIGADGNVINPAMTKSATQGT